MKVKFTKVIESESPSNGYDPLNQRHVNDRKVDIRMAAEKIMQNIQQLQGLGYFRDPSLFVGSGHDPCIVVEGESKFTSGAAVVGNNVRMYITEWIVCHLDVLMSEMDESGKLISSVEVSLNDDDMRLGYEISLKFSCLKRERVARLSVLAMTQDYEKFDCSEEENDVIRIR